MRDCIFCKIISGDIPSAVVYNDDDLLLFKDVNPQAPVHLLAIPKKHISSLNDLSAGDAHLIAKLFLKMKELAMGHKEMKKGYRIVTNCGRESGQSVFHIHFHLLGGRPMRWPPG